MNKSHTAKEGNSNQGLPGLQKITVSKESDEVEDVTKTTKGLTKATMPSPISLSFPGYDSSKSTHISSSTAQPKSPSASFFELPDLPDSPPPPLPSTVPNTTLNLHTTSPLITFASTPKKPPLPYQNQPVIPQQHFFQQPFMYPQNFQTYFPQPALSNNTPAFQHMNMLQKPDHNQDWRPSNEEIIAIKNRSHSVKIFSQRLMRRIFPLQERQGKSVYGSSVLKDGKVVTKEALDFVKVEFIKSVIFNIYMVAENKKKSVWSESRNSMNEYLNRKKFNDSDIDFIM